MKGRLWRKALAAAMALLIVSGNVPIQPVADLFGNIAITANAETATSTINISGTDYTLFTGFTATGGNGMNYAKLVDGNTSTDWIAAKSYGEVTNHFNGGTADPAFVEFHADEPIVPKGYVLTCDHENAGFWKPVEWALKAKLNEGDEWTTIHSSNTALGAGKTFEIACDNDDNNEYQYFRFEVYEVGTTRTVDLDELQFYGSLPAYTHLTVKAATCTATGIKQDCYRRNSDGKYFTDETGATELAESDVIAPIIAHNGIHHEATDVNIEYWECSMCHKLFSDEDCTTEITEEQTKIYRTITIDNSISGLVRNGFSKTQALAGETVYLYISDLIDASTLKVNDGAVELTAVTDIQYAFTMPAADVTVTADVAQSNADGDVLTGSIRHTVTIPDGASITLNNATITGSIVCEGSATITLVGTNSVSGATNKAGIQIGGSGTTLTIRGDGSLTANGGSQSAGIGLSRIWNYDSNVSSGDIVIEGGTITAIGGYDGAGIGIGTVKNTNNDNSTSVQFGNVTIKGGTVTATDGGSGDGIGKGYSYPGPAITFGTVTIYDGIDKVDASSIKDFANVVYMHGESNVTASKTDYFTIGEDSNRRLIVQKPVIAEIAEQAYTGSAVTPEPQVTIGSLNLTKGTDYEYSYTDNTNAGTATVTVTFKGDYASLGSVEKTFAIVRNIYISDGIEHGSITPDSYFANEGDTVTLTVTPDDGYAVKSVKYNDGTDHVITPVEDVYSFTMPESNVTVSAEYTKLPYVNVNVTGGGSVTYDDNSAADSGSFEVITEKGAEIPLILTPDSGYTVKSVEYGYTNKYGTNMSGAKLPISNGTATLTVPDDLKDGTGVTITVTFASALVGGADESSAVALTDNTVTDLAGGWYKVESDITFDHTLNLLGDTHLVIADDKTMNVTPTTGKGIDSDYTLNVSGAGTLNVTGTGEYSIAIRVGSYVQTGATVTASGFIGIRCYDNFDADVTNDFTFRGGQLIATGTSDGIRADNSITLGYTNASDFIQASSYDSKNGIIAADDSKMFTDGTNEYSSTLSNNDIKGKKLTPVAKTLTLPTSIANGTLTADQSENVLVGDTVTLTVTPDEGYAVKSVTYNDGTDHVITPVEGVYSFTMPAEDVTVSAEFEEARNIINAANITLGGELGLNFYLTIPDDAVTAGAKVVMNGPEGEKEVALSSMTKDDKGRYRVTYKIKAVYINENVSLYVADSEGNTLDLFKASGSQVDSNTLAYSIYDYVRSAKADTTLNEKEHNMVDMMYTYGAYSAKWFNGTELPADVNSLNDLTMSDYEKYKLQTDGSSDSITLTGLSLVLDSNTALRLYFTSADDISGHFAKVDDIDLTIHPTETAGKYYVEIDDISANNLISNYSIVFDGNYTATVSTMTYVYNSLKNGTTDDVMNVLKALCAYSDAVNES